MSQNGYVAAVDSANDAQSIFEYFSDTDIRQLTIVIDMDSLLTDAKKASYVPGVLEESVGSDTIQWNVRLRQRGKTRRKVCNFPPLKIKFHDTDLSVAGFLPYDDMKIVTHCFEGVEGERNILREYAAYRIYNKLCPASFRVQLARIRYVDASGKSPERVHLAFFIESKEELADRLTCMVKNKYGMTRDSLDEYQFMFLSVFQYFIGNTDWAVPIKHNLVLIDPEGDQKVFAIPYDFDYSGLVNAAYARPNPNLNQIAVTERVFMSHCNDLEILEAVLTRFQEVKEDVMSVFDEIPLLQREDRVEMRRYLEAFYAQTRNPAKFKRKIISKACNFQHKL
ncbi:MAG: hypothetical protein AAF990_25025 [Bacteroidota bacterium]